MIWKDYRGQYKLLYRVVETSDGWIELQVYHDNTGLRRSLQAHLDKPSDFLDRIDTFRRSRIREDTFDTRLCASTDSFPP